jgi:hypothetical protein
VTGTTTSCTELDAGSPSPAAVTADRPHRKPSGDWRRARRQPRFCETLLDTGRYQRSSGAAMPPGRRPRSGRCLILMGVWRDPRCGRSHQPKKRARFKHGGWMRRLKSIGSSRCQKKTLCVLTTGRLMGVTVIPGGHTHQRGKDKRPARPTAKGGLARNPKFLASDNKICIAKGARVGDPGADAILSRIGFDGPLVCQRPF